MLRDVFGYDAFRPGQHEVIEAVLAGRDTLAVMPTGGGKSVCFQVPALLFDGLTLVVSPLLALMKDQVDALRSAGVAAAAINSSVSFEDQQATLRDAATGKLQLLYVAPERFGNGTFTAALRGLPIALLAIDEAHCISQWGHDFRPSYRDLGGVRARIGDVPIVALTATADPRVRADILERLALREPTVHVAGFDRPNLRFDVEHVRSKKEKAELITEKLRTLKDDSAIVYCGTRKNVNALTDHLQHQGIKCARYHAGMADEDRRRIQDAFARDSLRIIVATNAFGMGIDKPDVRLVLHHDMPDSLESYYQEAGRAGRDGEPAECVLYFGSRDRALRDFFIEMSHPEASRVVEIYRDLVGQNGQRVHSRDVMRSDDEPGVNAAIAALVESGLAGRQGYMVWATRPGGEDEIDTASLEQHRQHAISKVDAMQRYAESRTCLRARILDYFSDAGHAVACGNCGPCVAPPVRGYAAASGAEEDLFQQLRAVRRQFAEEAGVPPFVIFSDATLRDMARLSPRTRAEMLNVSGVGQVKYERYGEAFLAVTRVGSADERTEYRVRSGANSAARRESTAPSQPGSISSSLRMTLGLARDGLGIAEIARERRLAVSTIATHLAQLIHFGHFTQIEELIDPALLERLREVAGPGQIGALAPLREALGGDVPYEQLHIARAWLNRPISQ